MFQIYPPGCLSDAIAMYESLHLVIRRLIAFLLVYVMRYDMTFHRFFSVLNQSSCSDPFRICH